MSPDIVAAAINRDLFLKELDRAQHHYNGKGIGAGIHIDATLAVLRNLNNDNYASKCLLETVLSAATWPNERIHDEIDKEYPSLCQRCGQAAESALHCFWQCEANNNICDPAVQDTQALCNKAVEASVDFPCLWLRGLLPAGLIVIPPEASPVNEDHISWVSKEPVHMCSGLYYGDASGGDFTRYKDIRRVGCAFVVIDEHGVLRFAAHFPLPGAVQTVSRGELYALVMLIRQAQEQSDIELITDNKGVNDKYNAGPKVASLSSNCDLYHELFRLLHDKQIRLKVRWMPSHLKEQDKRPVDVTLLDIKGNDLADQYAKEAAAKVQVPLQVSSNCVYYYNLVKDIQWRVITIIKNLPIRRKCVTIRTTKELTQDLDSIISQSRHHII